MTFPKLHVAATPVAEELHRVQTCAAVDDVVARASDNDQIVAVPGINGVAEAVGDHSAGTVAGEHALDGGAAGQR